MLVQVNDASFQVSQPRVRDHALVKRITHIVAIGAQAIDYVTANRHAGTLPDESGVTWLVGFLLFGADSMSRPMLRVHSSSIPTRRVARGIQSLDMQSTTYRNESEEPDDSESGYGKSKGDNGKDGEKRGVINRVNSECCDFLHIWPELIVSGACVSIRQTPLAAALMPEQLSAHEDALCRRRGTAV